MGIATRCPKLIPRTQNDADHVGTGGWPAFALLAPPKSLYFSWTQSSLIAPRNDDDDEDGDQNKDPPRVSFHVLLYF